MNDLVNVYQFHVGFENSSRESYCDWHDGVIYFGEPACVVEDESGASITVCQKCFAEIESLDK